MNRPDLVPQIINGADHHIIRLREPYRRWLILHYGPPQRDLAIESGSRSSCHEYLRCAILDNTLPKPLYAVFVRPKNYTVAFPGADK